MLKMSNMNILSALDLNARLQAPQEKFQPFIKMIDEMSTQAPLNQQTVIRGFQQFGNELVKLTAQFTDLPPIYALALASTWGAYLKQCMAVFIKADHLGYDDKLIEQISMLSNKATIEHGLIMLKVDEPIELPCHSAMRNIQCNSLELSLFLNTGALEIAVNSLHALNCGDTKEKYAFGIDVQKNPETFAFFEKFARHQHDVLYDLKWGSMEEEENSPAYKQRNQAMNVSNLFALCD